MEKAWDLKDLWSRQLKALKSQAVPATANLLDWTSESCALSSNAILKGIGGVIVAVKPTVLEEIGKAVA